MKTRTRVTIEEAARAYQRLAERLTKDYPKELAARTRTVVVGLALKLVNLAIMLVSALQNLPLPSGRKDQGDLLKVDSPIVKVREYCRALVEDWFQRGGTLAERPDFQVLRERLAKEPELGDSLVDACLYLLWIVRCYLQMQMGAEVSELHGLPSEEFDDLVDEAARADISKARKDMSLARMRLFGDDEDVDCDPLLLGATRRDTGRRRERIEAIFKDLWPVYQEQLDEQLQALLAMLPEDSSEARNLRGTWATMSDQSKPEARQHFKRWLTMFAYMDSWVTEEEVAKAQTKSGQAAS